MASTTFTPNLGLPQPAVNDPSSNNAWGTLENEGRTLIDNYGAAWLPLPTTGGTTTLTSTNGASDQSRNRVLNITGVLTGNATILMPQTLQRAFSVFNQTTGAFTLSIGANNGSGAAAGTTVVVPQGLVIPVISDGTNCYLDEKAGAKLQGSSFQSRAAAVQFSTATPTTYLTVNYTPQFANSTIDIRATLTYASTVVNGASGAVAKMTAGLYENGSLLFNVQGGAGPFTGVAGLTLAPIGSLSLEWQKASPGAGSSVAYTLECSDANASGLTNQALTATLIVQEYY